MELLGTNEVFSFGPDFKQFLDDLQHHNVLHYGRIHSFFLANLLQKFIPVGLGCMLDSLHLIFQSYAALICQLFFFVFQFWIWIFSTSFALEKKLKKDKESNFRTNTHFIIRFFLLNYFIMKSQIFLHQKGTFFLTSTKFSTWMEHLWNFQRTGYQRKQISRYL